jgi:hypothetical protein
VKKKTKISAKDQAANRLGRERRRANPTCDCRKLMEDLKPPNMPEFTTPELMWRLLEQLGDWIFRKNEL